jgi:hypothetical protein
MVNSEQASDPRKPSLPFGYSKICKYSLEQQIDIVALFHANRIKPNRIAYRVGIDLDLIEKLLGEQAYQKQFKFLVAKHRKNRRSQRLKESTKIVGIGQAEMQSLIEKEYSETQLP